MSTKLQFACDGLNCTETRGACNHWFLLHRIEGTLTIQPWTDEFAVEDGTLHMCGQACVQRFVEGWMNSLANSEGQPK